MVRRNGWIIFRDGGGGECPYLKHLGVQYDFKKVQLSGRGRKKLPIIRMWEKLWQNLFCRNHFNLHDAKPPLFQQYFFKPMKVLNKENKASHVKYDFRFFFSKCVYMPDINFSKCVVTALSFSKSRYLRNSENTLTKF